MQERKIRAPGKHSSMGIRIGQAGWSISKSVMPEFPNVGSHLERYAQKFSAVEINSTFYKSHKSETYARWASSVPSNFKFSVKIPKTVTHVNSFTDIKALDKFLLEITPLKEKMGPLLMQTPPFLVFDPFRVADFLKKLRRNHLGDIVCEARHESWFTNEADRLLSEFDVFRVLADPSRGLNSPGLFRKELATTYYRLHGSPRIYYTPYSEAYLQEMAVTLFNASKKGSAWCIFDNTAEGSSMKNALRLSEIVEEVRRHLRTKIHL